MNEVEIKILVVQTSDPPTLSFHRMCSSPGNVSENPVTQVKQRKGWRMSSDVGKAHSPSFQSLHLRHSSSNPSLASPTSQLILQHFPRFTYVTAHSPTLPLLHLRHSSFSNPSSASPTSQDFHLRHLARRPCFPDLSPPPQQLHKIRNPLRYLNKE